MDAKTSTVADTRQRGLSPEARDGLLLLGFGLLGYLSGVLLAFLSAVQAGELAWSVSAAVQAAGRTTFVALGCFGSAATLTVGLAWLPGHDALADKPRR